MRKARWMIVIPLLLLASLACGLMNGIQQMQDAATQLPGMLTAAAPTLEALGTSAAEITPTGDGKLSLQNAKLMLEMTQQFKLSDETVDGQAAVVARLTEGSASTFSAIGTGFSAAFIGDDPNDLSEIKVTVPRSDSKDSVDQGIAVTNLAVAGALPPDVQVGFTSWLTEEYGKLEVSGTSDKTIGKIQFKLERTDASMVLTIVPAQ
jgi:hypothetical protein